MIGPSTRFPDVLVTLNLLPRPLLEISPQELPTRLVHKTSMRNLGTKSPDISGPPGKTSVKDLLKALDLLNLLTGALYKISSQDPYERSLYKSSLRSPDIPGPPRSLNRSSLQDLFTRPL